MACSGPIDLWFEQGLLEVWTCEKPACQGFATWSVLAIVNCLIGRVFRVCSGFAHTKTQHARVLAANALFSSLFPVGWCLLMMPEALEQISMFEREWQVNMCFRGSLPLSNYCVCSLAAGFRFHLCWMCIPLPPEFQCWTLCKREAS